LIRVSREVTRWDLRKAGVEEWLVKAVMAMYEGAQTVVRTTEGDIKAFNVKVGLHQGSVLSPLLFVIVMEMISGELQAGLPLELLYADNLFLMAVSEENLCDKIVKWKLGLEAKGLKMNTGKTNVMFSCSMKDKVEEKGKCHLPFSSTLSFILQLNIILLSGPVVYVRRELAIIRFCSMVARSGFINNIVE